MGLNGLVIRCLQATDIPAADQVLIPAFDRPQSRADELARYLKLQPDGWFIGFLDGVPVATVGAVDYGPLAYVGLMGVHPAYQGQGLGRALLTHLLAWLDARQVPAILLDATDRGFPLYASLGFEFHDLAHIFIQDAPPACLPPPPAYIQPLEARHLDELVAFDTPVFGADRRRVFQLLLEAGAPAFLARSPGGPGQGRLSGGLQGYIFVQGKRLGPWVAKDVQAAEGLLQAAEGLLQAAEGLLQAALAAQGTVEASGLDKQAIISLPGANPGAEALLARYGFHRRRHIRHMRRGRLVTPEQRAWVYGQTSFAIG